MVDINKLRSALDGYKQDYPPHWQVEKKMKYFLKVNLL